MIVPVPSLDEIARNPACADGLQPETLAKLLAQIAAAQSVVAARLVAATIVNGNGTVPVEADEMLTVAEAAKVLRKTARWIWRRKKTLPFVRQINRRSMLVSKRELMKWIARQGVR